MLARYLVGGELDGQVRMIPRDTSRLVFPKETTPSLAYYPIPQYTPPTSGVDTYVCAHFEMGGGYDLVFYHHTDLQPDEALSQITERMYASLMRDTARRQEKRTT